MLKMHLVQYSIILYVLEINHWEVFIFRSCLFFSKGETSAGKTTLINQLVGKDTFFTNNLAATGTLCRIRDSKSLSVQIHSKDHYTEEKVAANLDELASLLKQYTDIENNPPEMIDVYLPVPILKVISMLYVMGE